jgi:hypothetical protein
VVRTAVDAVAGVAVRLGERMAGDVPQNESATTSA